MAMLPRMLQGFEEDPMFEYDPFPMSRHFQDPFQEMNQLMSSFGMNMPMRLGFPSMFNGLMDMPPRPQNIGSAHVYSSSTVISSSNDGSGRPQVYKASHSTRMAPGGVREVRKTVEDSRTGVRKMAIGHHLGERGHVLERKQNYVTGEQEQNQEFINMDEEEADQFNQEWERQTRRSLANVRHNRRRPLRITDGRRSHSHNGRHDGRI